MGMPKFINDYLEYDVETYIDGEVEPPLGDTLVEWLADITRFGIRIGLKYNAERSAYIASATSKEKEPNYPDGWCITAFGGDITSAVHKLWVVLEGYSGKHDIDGAWLAIGEQEREIKAWLRKQMKNADYKRKNGA